MADNADNTSSPTNNSKGSVAVRTDPETGKKYFYQNGHRFEIITNPTLIKMQQSNNSKTPLKGVTVLNLTKLVPKASAQVPETTQTIIKPTVVDPKPTTTDSESTSADFRAQVLKMVLENAKQRRLAERKMEKWPRTVSTMTEVNSVDKSLQTDLLERKEIGIQTDIIAADYCLTSELVDSVFFDWLNEPELSVDLNRIRDVNRTVMLIEPNRPKTKEEVDKMNFFWDMQQARRFDKSGNLPIHDSILQNNPKLVKKNCIILKARRDSINLQNSQSCTPLHLCILRDAGQEILKILLDHGADLNQTDSAGNTAFHLAVEHNRINLLRPLLDYASNKKFSLNIFNYDGLTPLILSVCNKSYDISRLLLERGADPNVRDLKSGRTALFHGAETYDMTIVSLLMEYRADTKIRNFFGTSPHDAMFELDDIPQEIKKLIVGRELNTKRKTDGAPMQREMQSLPTTAAAKRSKTVIVEAPSSDTGEQHKSVVITVIDGVGSPNKNKNSNNNKSNSKSNVSNSNSRAANLKRIRVKPVLMKYKEAKVVLK